MQVKKMQALGFRCSLDDFGAGFSSLELLAEFDIDVLKLDRKFSQNIENCKMRELILSIGLLAKKLGVLTVAEGIETQEQLAFFKDLHFEIVQGFVFARPMPIPDFEKWLADRGEKNPCITPPPPKGEKSL
jgi:EAL domain-containing protein (putative c-di-GMP-specific phosphodiesterase class I)